MPLAHSYPVTRSRAGYAVGKPAGAGRCQTRPVRSEAMPLHALDDSGQPVRVLEGGPRRASCAECGAPMRARTGPVRIWHWAHLVHNPRCKAARATEWHLAWKVLAWPAVALRGIELVHSLGRRPSVNMDGITLCGIGVTGTHAAPPIWTVATPRRSPAEARRSGCSVLQHRPDLPK